MDNNFANTQAIIANAQSQAAMAAARKAKEISCKSYISSFDPKTATVEQMQQYAECVEVLHPQPMSHDDVIAAKFFFALALIGMLVCGGWQLYKYGLHWWEDALIHAALGFFLVPIGVGIILVLIAGVLWLFGAI